jgi:hypothetical protein
MFSSRKQYIDHINDLYDTSREKNLLIGSSDYWPVVRIHLSYLCHLKFVGKEISYPGLATFSKFSFPKLLSLVRRRINLELLIRKYKFDSKNIILLIGFNDHYSKSGINPYIHPVINLLNENKIENKTLILRNIDNEEYETSLSELFNSLFSYYDDLFYLGKNNSSLAVSHEIAKEIKEHFLFEDFDKGSIEGVCNKIANECNKSIIYRKTFLKFLQIIKPSIIWTSVYYDNRILSLNLVANKLKIPIIEYQHSMQGNDHFAYSKWENIDMIRNYFPSIYWVWRNSDAEMIKKNFCGDIYQPKILEGGNIYLAQEKSKVDPPEKDNEKANGILVTLQGLWVPSFVEEAVEKCLGFTWYFRLHPRYPVDRSKLEELKWKFPDRVEIEQANNLSLYQIFNKVRFNLTSFSGTAIEAHAFGIINVIFSAEGESAYSDMISNKAFLYASNFSELQNILNSNSLEVNLNYNRMETDMEIIKRSIYKLPNVFHHIEDDLR